MLEPLGERKLRGREDPVAAWRLLGIEPGGGPIPSTPLIGRASELATLERTVADLLNGRGQILLIGGEAGIGKSRLISELRALTPSEVSWLEGHCVSYGGDRRFRPFVESLAGWLGVAGDEPDVIARTKLRAKMEELIGDAWTEVAPAFTRMLSVRPEAHETSSLLGLGGQELDARFRWAYGAWIERLCERSPVVLVIEDVHSADRSTRELAQDLLAITDSCPLLLVLSGRYVPGAEGWQLWMRVLEEFRHRSVELDLTPLDREDAAAFADLLSPTGLLDASSRSLVVDRAEGNPLYLEELTAAMVESGGLERGRGWTLTATGPSLMLPPALESLLAVRIQNLPSGARHLAQIAAIIGREFPLSVIEQLAPEANVDENLPILLRSEIIRERRRTPQLIYTFRNSLLRQAVIAGLTPASSKRLYGMVGGIFEAMYGDAEPEHAERLAYYYYRSNDPAKSLPYMQLAAERAEGTEPERARHLWKRVRRLAGRSGDLETQRRADAILTRLDAQA